MRNRKKFDQVVYQVEIEDLNGITLHQFKYKAVAERKALAWAERYPDSTIRVTAVEITPSV